MGRMMDILGEKVCSVEQQQALERLGELKEAYSEGDDLSDLVKAKSHPHFDNPLCLGAVGPYYDVWVVPGLSRNRVYRVRRAELAEQRSEPESCHTIAHETLREAVQHARDLNAQEQAEYQSFLGRCGLPQQAQQATARPAPDSVKPAKPVRKRREKKEKAENFSVDDIMR